MNQNQKKHPIMVIQFCGEGKYEIHLICNTML